MNFFNGLAVILGVAAMGGIIAKLLKQPVIVGYILSGVVISLLRVITPGSNGDMVVIMGQVGVTLLLFLVGLELPLNELNRMGKSSAITGVSQIILTSLLGFGLARLLGFAVIPATYLGIGLAFGSTVLVINLLSAKKDLQSVYGRIAVGFLLVQDFVAIGLMVVLSGVATGGFNPVNLIWVMVKGVILVCVAAWLSGKILPKFLDWFGKSTEILFIVSLGWCLVVAALVASPWVGFTVELGGFLAGLTLANAAQNLQIISRIRPLRDFFMTLFFVGLGASISVDRVGVLIVPAIILSIFVLIGNPLILMSILGALGYKKRIAFLAGVTVAQVSEFSLIVVTIAAKVGQVNSDLVSLVAIVALVTMLFSSYMIMHADKIYRKIKNILWFYERKSNKKPDMVPEPVFGEVVLFGHNRIGKIVRPVLQKLGKKILVVDFDPQILSELKQLGIPAVYGDIADFDLYSEIDLEKAKLIVSTISDTEDNLKLISFVNTLNKNKPALILLALDNTEAKRLYAKGADYVLVPHSVAGEYLIHLFNNNEWDGNSIRKIGKMHAQELA
jgi:Kef-type K+ transport system membrane component KefB